MANLQQDGILIVRFLGGPFAGREFYYEKPIVTLGRSAEADITVSDSLLSRIHMEFFKVQDRGWFVRDLDSKNGTWQEGNRMHEVLALKEQQSFRAGHSLIEVFVKNTVDPVLESHSVSFRFNPENFAEATVFDYDSLPIETVRDEHRRLSIIYRIQNELSHIVDENEIYSRTLQTLVKETRASYSYIFLYDKNHFKPVCGLDCSGHTIQPSSNPYSNSILEYVRKKNEGILTNDAAVDKRVFSESLEVDKPQSIICVPLSNNQEFIGALYLTVFAPSPFFTETDLQLIAGVGHTVSMAVTNSRLTRKDLRNERMAALGSTAASLSHYIKNILTGVDGCLYLLNMGIEDGDKVLTGEAMDILQRNHKRLSSLVLDLLNLAKDDTLDMQVHNIPEIISDVVDLVKTSFHKDNVEIHQGKTLNDAESQVADVDGKALHRVILNLINNAFDALRQKFHGEKGGVISIDARLDEEFNKLEIEIRDNGLGIPEDKLDVIFEMFYTGKDEGGTGLGLAVSKRLIELHGGNLRVSSEIGKYTSFVIHLPVSHQNTKTIPFH